MHENNGYEFFFILRLETAIITNTKLCTGINWIIHRIACVLRKSQQKNIKTKNTTTGTQQWHNDKNSRKVEFMQIFPMNKPP